ncbi:MAG: hypothetical protein ACJ764_12770 [Solirubrobacteraceae bacterium]
MLRPKLVLSAAAVAVGVLVSGCGGGGGVSSAVHGTTNSNELTHAQAVELLPTSAEVRSVIRPTASPTRSAQVLNMDTLSSAFATATVRARRLAAGTAELDVTGRGGRYLYVRIFVFKTLTGARSLWPAFRATTGFRKLVQPGSGAPGEQRLASVQAYCPHKTCMSYRYAFRDQNALSYVELDGPRAAYTLTDALRIAAITDRQIRKSLS